MKTTSNISFLICLHLVICFLIIGSCYNPKPLPSINTTPDTLRRVALDFLSRNRIELMAAIDTIKSLSFKYPVCFFDNNKNGYRLYSIVDGFYYNISDSCMYINNWLIHNFEDKQSHIAFESDTVLFLFSNLDYVDERLFPYLCYSECSYNELCRHKYAKNVYSKNVIPDFKGSFFWEIDDNWYVYVPKFLKFSSVPSDIKDTYRWAIDNKQSFFYKEEDTLNTIVKKLQQLFFQEDSLYLVEMEGLFQVESRKKNIKQRYFLHTRNTFLDSLFSNAPACPFVIYYYQNYIKFELRRNFHLHYIYSELHQKDLEQLLKMRVHLIEDNWYYEDF